jgi:dynein heavy chain, axonemal
LAGECNYGGRVTDERDRRTLLALLQTCYNNEILGDDYRLSSSGIYYAPKKGSYESYITYIKSLPIFQNPEAFGMHENADISKDLNETNSMINSILLTQVTGSGSSNGSKDQDEITSDIAKGILLSLIDDFNIESAKKLFPVQ